MNQSASAFSAVGKESAIPSLEDSNGHFTHLDLSERLTWVNEHYQGKWMLSTSFGIQSAVLLHALSVQFPEIPVVFVDTGYLFPETYQFAEALSQRLSFQLHRYSARRSAAYQEAVEGKRWEQGPEALQQYNFENKIEPMNRAVEELGVKAWVSGIRRSQSSSRQDRDYIEEQQHTTKVYPIVDWSDRDIYQYLQKYDLPYHPLWDEGYVSVGDWHSTSKLLPGMNEEDTRFGGVKRECGLHEVSGNTDFQI